MLLFRRMIYPKKWSQFSGPALTLQLFPLFLGPGRHVLEIVAHDIPVDHWLLIDAGRCGVPDIGAADGEQNTDNDTEKQTHFSISRQAPRADRPARFPAMAWLCRRE